MQRINKTVLSATIVAFLMSAPVMISGQARAEEGVMCTMDAKQCPDGSFVSRTGPKCEFAPCPGEGGDDKSTTSPKPPTTKEKIKDRIKEKKSDKTPRMPPVYEGKALK